MIKVTFKEPVNAYDFCVLPPLSFTAKFIFCKTYSQTESSWDIITIGVDKPEHLSIDLSTFNYNIKSIEHVKPTDL